jgi:hypothetical protein
MQIFVSFRFLDSLILELNLDFRFVNFLNSDFIAHICRFFQPLDLCIRLLLLRRQLDSRFVD